MAPDIGKRRTRLGYTRSPHEVPPILGGRTRHAFIASLSLYGAAGRREMTNLLGIDYRATTMQFDFLLACKLLNEIDDPFRRAGLNGGPIKRWMVFDGRHPALHEIIALARAICRRYHPSLPSMGAYVLGRPDVLAAMNADKHELASDDLAVLGPPQVAKTLLRLSVTGGLTKAALKNLNNAPLHPYHMVPLLTSGLVNEGMHTGGNPREIWYTLNPLHAVAAELKAVLVAFARALPNEVEYIRARGFPVLG